MSTNFSDEIENYSGAWAILGAVVMVIAGLLAICLPLATSTALGLILAWLLIVAGIGHLFAAFRLDNFATFIWELLVGAAALFVGFYMRTHPAMTLASLVFILAVLFLVSGISELALFFRIRSAPDAGWIFVNAVVDIILGLIVLRHWPANSVWLLGILVGISLVVAGLSRLAFALHVRQPWRA